MMLRIKYGFSFDDMNFGWINKELFRLPSKKNKRTFCLKKLDSITIGNKVGYRIGGKRFTLEQLEEMTNFIDVEINKLKDKDCPF